MMEWIESIQNQTIQNIYPPTTHKSDELQRAIKNSNFTRKFRFEVVCQFPGLHVVSDQKHWLNSIYLYTELLNVKKKENRNQKPTPLHELRNVSNDLQLNLRDF